MIKNFWEKLSLEKRIIINGVSVSSAIITPILLTCRISFSMLRFGITNYYNDTLSRESIKNALKNSINRNLLFEILGYACLGIGFGLIITSIGLRRSTEETLLRYANSEERKKIIRSTERLTKSAIRKRNPDNYPVINQIILEFDDDIDLSNCAYERSLRCPITLDIMRDPVIADDERTYERSALTTWYLDGNLYCPMNPSVILSDPEEMNTDPSMSNLIWQTVQIALADRETPRLATSRSRQNLSPTTYQPSISLQQATIR